MHPILDFILLSSEFQHSRNHYGDLSDAKQLWAALHGKSHNITGMMRRIEVNFTTMHQNTESSGTIRSFVGAFEIDGDVYSIRGACGWQNICIEHLEAEWIAHERHWHTKRAQWMEEPIPLEPFEHGASYIRFENGVAQWQATQLHNRTTSALNQAHIPARL